MPKLTVLGESTENAKLMKTCAKTAAFHSLTDKQNAKPLNG